MVRERNIELRDRKAEDNGDGNVVMESLAAKNPKPETPTGICGGQFKFLDINTHRAKKA